MKEYPSYRDLERMHGLSWHDIADMEPRLAALLCEAHRAGAVCRRWSDVESAFAPLRGHLATLVGFCGKHRWHPILGSQPAYDVAYWKLYDAVAALVPGAQPTEREQPADLADAAAMDDLIARAGTRWPRFVPLPS
jgi:hypothetical protein